MKLLHFFRRPLLFALLACVSQQTCAMDRMVVLWAAGSAAIGGLAGAALMHWRAAPSSVASTEYVRREDLDRLLAAYATTAGLEGQFVTPANLVEKLAEITGNDGPLDHSSKQHRALRVMVIRLQDKVDGKFGQEAAGLVVQLARLADQVSRHDSTFAKCVTSAALAAALAARDGDSGSVGQLARALKELQETGGGVVSREFVEGELGGYQQAARAEFLTKGELGKFAGEVSRAAREQATEDARARRELSDLVTAANERADEAHGLGTELGLRVTVLEGGGTQ